jgi:hypothetical protein
VSPITGAVSEHTSREGIAIRRFELYNRSGGLADVGIGFRLANRYWVAGQFTDAGVFAYDTDNAQDVGANDFILGADATNDGFVIAARIPFNWFSINVGTAEVDAGAAVDHAVRYSNTAGTGWTALGSGAAYLDQFTLTNTVIGTGAREFIWDPPADWGKVTSLGGIPEGFYAINITAAALGVGDTAALATSVEIGTMRVAEDIVNNGMYAYELANFVEPMADAIVAYFSTASAANRVYAEVTTA